MPELSEPKTPFALSVETLALLASLFFSLACNRVVWHNVLADRPWDEAATWGVVGCVFVALTAFQFLLLALVLTRRNARIVIGALLIVSAVASHFIETYNVFLDSGMLRNVLHTDLKEASELLSPALLWHVAWQAALPIWLLWRVPLIDRPRRHALPRRLAALLAGCALLAAGLLLAFQDAADIARNHREWRFLVTPSNVVYALARLGSSKAQTLGAPLQPIGTDAKLGASWQRRTKPVLLVVFVGETARAANWGLNGYARQTTPQLAALPVINFTDVSSCGTDTESSLPCMFGPWGLRGHDATRERSQESLLHVLQRAKLPVLWRDNQSGCKGLCAGVETERLDNATVPGLCEEGHCFDEILLNGLDQRVADGASRVLVLHSIGSHGPAYYRRYPDRFRHFTPTCETDELRKCSVEQIVNSYDNTLLYTDHVLASTVRWLRSHEGDHDSALIYVSDHGESLGEHNLFLHGMPRSIAPKEQTHVPMVMWFSSGFAAGVGLDTACLRARASQPASHDHLFHSVLGLLDVQTAVYESEFDLTRPCRR